MRLTDAFTKLLMPGTRMRVTIACAISSTKLLKMDSRCVASHT
jgi:hypothetical protein